MNNERRVARAGQAPALYESRRSVRLSPRVFSVVARGQGAKDAVQRWVANPAAAHSLPAKLPATKRAEENDT